MSQALFASDYPHLRRDLAVACRHEVEASPDLSENERQGVLDANGLKLFPRLGSHHCRKFTPSKES